MPRRHSFSFTACFFAALACLIQLPNSIEAGWKGRDGTGCTATYSHKKEGDCAGKDWEERNGWAGIKKDWAWHNDGGCSKDCGGGIQKKRYLYNFKRITSCETKDERMRRCEFTYDSTIESDTKEESCNTQACPPPPSPPSPPPLPPPSPPPPGSNGVPTVAIGVQALQVTDREFDFQITVSDNDCSDVTNCLGTPFLVNANTAKGLQCDAYVASSSTDTSCTYATSGSYLPCKKWTNFYDSTKADEYKFTLTMTDASNELVTGTYQIKYECYWLMADGVTKAPETTTGEQTLHEFVVEEGCSDWLSLSTVPLEKSFLLSSPDFLSINDCDTVDYVKEMVF